MHIVVCAKQVPNPEAAFSMFRIDEEAKRMVPAPGLQLVMSPFDEQAVEAALRIREHHADARTTVLTLGPDSARNAIKHGLAMGADEGVLLCDAAFEDADSYTTAHALVAAIRKLGRCDLVLTGRQAADWDAGVVGAGVGELLGLPVITFAKDVHVEDTTVRIERVLDDGTEIMEAAMPALVTVSNELGAARTPNLRETMRAARKPVTVWKAADLGLAADEVGAAGARRVVERLFVPVKNNRCEFIAGSPEEQAAGLAQRLRAAKLI
ncbi:MAG: electron transfer flavoprotein subunit beta/FixA family protein [Betaproteobacteria bacterium]|nr:electron transfer flavoprotein subunit beta/FixA family protein [Betaproteobacteria bacterium]